MAESKVNICPNCSGHNTHHVKGVNGYYHCKDCNTYFEVDDSEFHNFADFNPPSTTT